MRRKQATILYSSITVTAFIAVPIFLGVLSPNTLLWLFRLAYLSTLVALLYFVLPSGKTVISGGSSLALSSSDWILHIFLLEFTAFFLFLSEGNVFATYLMQNHLISSTARSAWVGHLVTFTFLNWGLFPWGFFAAASIVFIRTKLKYQSTHHLTDAITTKKNVLGWLIRRTWDIYLISVTRGLLAFIIGMIALSLSLYLYPTYCSLLHPLPGMTTAAIILIFFNLKRFEKLFRTLEEKKIAPYKNFFLLLIITTLITCLASLATYHFALPKNKTMIEQWTSLPLLPHSSISSLTQLLAFIWWLLITPLLSSLICYYSSGRSIRLTLLVTLIPPIILLLLINYWHSWLYSFDYNNALFLFCYGLSFILFFYLFRKASSNQISWFGYMPNQAMKKLRVASPRQLWLFVPILLGIFSITGLHGIVLLGIIGALPLLLLYLFLNLKMLFT